MSFEHLKTLDKIHNQVEVSNYTRAQYYYIRGFVFLKNSSYEDGMKCFRKAYDRFVRAESLIGRLSTMYSMASLNYGNSKMNLQKNHLDSVMKIYEKDIEKYPFIKANFCTVNGFFNFMGPDESEGFRFLHSALGIYEAYKDSANISRSSHNLALVYSLYPDQMDSTLHYITKSAKYKPKVLSPEKKLYDLLGGLTFVVRGVDEKKVMSSYGFASTRGLINYFDSIYYSGNLSDKLAMHYLSGKSNYVKRFGTPEEYVNVMEEEMQLYYHLYVSDTSKQQLVQYQLDLEQMRNEELRLRSESTKKEKQRLTEQLNERSKRYMILVISLLVVFALAGIIWYVTRKNRIERHKNNMLEMNRKQDLEQLKNAEQKLVLLKNQMLQKTQLIDQVKSELERSHQVQSEHKLKLMDMKILTNEDWATFKSTFDVVYPGMNRVLGEKDIQMTEGELRVLMLTKMNLGKVQISEITGIGPESVRKAMYRLRKKIEPYTIEELLKAF